MSLQDSIPESASSTAALALAQVSALAPITPSSTANDSPLNQSEAALSNVLHLTDALNTPPPHRPSSNISKPNVSSNLSSHSDTLLKFAQFMKKNTENVADSNSTTTTSNALKFETLINNLQQKINQPQSSISLLEKKRQQILSTTLDNNNNNNNNNDDDDDDDENLNVESFVKSNDLLLYYKIFNYFIWLTQTEATLDSLTSSSHSDICQFFNHLVLFSNSLSSGASTPHADEENIDLFNYDSLSTNPAHLNNLHRFQQQHGFANAGHNSNNQQQQEETPGNEQCLIHLIIKHYEFLSFKNLNYLMYLMGGFKPTNVYINGEDAHSEPESNTNNGSASNSENFKKLKSCSRCRKNKIKCDSAMKFPFSCLNCFKKNINYLKLSVKKVSVPDNDSTSFTGDNSNFVVNMARSSSSLTTASSTFSSNYNAVSLSPASSVSSDDAKHHLSGDANGCDCGSRSCLSNLNFMDIDSKFNRNKYSNLKLFLKLFNINIDKNDNSISFEEFDELNDYDPANNGTSTLTTCKVQLISSNLVLKKKSLKKNNLIKTLNKDISTMKAKINEMILKEEQMLQALYENDDLTASHHEDSESLAKLYSSSSSSDGNHTALEQFYNVKQSWEAKKRSRSQSDDHDDDGQAAKRQNLDNTSTASAAAHRILSTNELLILNGLEPVLNSSNQKHKSYYDFLKTNLKDISNVMNSGNNDVGYEDDVYEMDHADYLERLILPKVALHK